MVSLDRRGFIEISAAAALAGAGGVFALPKLWWHSAGARWVTAAGGAWAPSSARTPGFHRFPLGDFVITVLGDGWFQLPADSFGTNVTEARRVTYYKSRLLPLDAIRLPANPAVIDTGDRLVLVDSGTGATGDPPPSTGRLTASLAAAGIMPAAIDVIILTHAHGDHIGGLRDPATGELRFPNAEVVLSETEHALWTAADAARRVPDWAVDFGIIDANRAIFTALGDRVRTIRIDGEVMTGINGVDTAGHTPGHMGVLLSSAGEQMIVVGDAIANAHTHFEHPDWHMRWDHDQEQGARTRTRLLEHISADRLLVQGFHLPFPGVGHAVRDGRAYRWLPAV